MSALVPIIQLWIIVLASLAGYLALYGLCILAVRLWRRLQRARAYARYERDWPESDVEVRG